MIGYLQPKKEKRISQEDRELLLKDLCARLPYGIKGLHRDKVEEVRTIDGRGSFQNYSYGAWFPIDTFKPYLRSMSSMTEDEKKVYHKLLQMSVTVVMPNMIRKETSYIVDLEDDGDGLNHLYDWFNENHFDYRGLISMGLAIEAPEGMYD